MRSLFRRIKRNGVAISTLRILGTALVLAFGSQPIQTAGAAESAVVTPLMLKELADIPGKEMLMITVDYPPGAVDPVHRHDAHAFVYVLQGSIVMQVRGGKEVTLVPGQIFYEGPNDVHTVGRNASTTEPAKFIVILLKKKGVDVLDTNETDLTIPFGNRENFWELSKKRCLSSLTVGGDMPPPLFDASSKGLPGSALQLKA